MKNLLTLVVCVYTLSAAAQAPQAISYQAVARDSAGNLIINQSISIRFSVHDGGPAGAVVFQETHVVSTNDLGLFAAGIGLGTPLSGSFAAIQWGTGSKFLQVEMDATGGSFYSDMGTQQLLSVPYALYSGMSSASGNAWNISGNAGTDASHFIGTTDNVSLNFKVNNQKAGRIGASDASTFFGQYAGNNHTIFALSNTAIGQQALYNNTSGNGNTALGSGALYQAHNNNNVGIGFGALELNSTGSNNTAVGTMAGEQNNTGSGNVFLGNNAGFNETGSNKLYIANSSSNPPLIYGDFSSGRLGLGTVSPSQKLDVIGTTRTTNFQMTSGAVNGYFLQSDASGNASWVNMPGSGWGLTGNTGTNASINFIGTTDGVSLNFRVNNQKSGTIDYTAPNNTLIGYQSGNAITTGSNNTALGYQALSSDNSGSFNTAIGKGSMTSNTSGGANTSVGHNALQMNQTGQGNTAVGSAALNNNNGGHFNVAVGQSALQANQGFNNSGLGVNALISNTSGVDNTAVGSGTMYFSTTGHYNVAMGKDALYNNVAGVGGTAIGYNAMFYANNTAAPFINSNIAVGFEALKGSSTPSANTGNSNTCLGYKSLTGNSTGENNCAIGYISLWNNTTGINNVAIGSQTLLQNISGNQNTAIGFAAGPTSSNLSNATAIGANASVSVSNALVLGNNANVGIGLTNPTHQLQLAADDAAKPGTSTWTIVSDARLKKTDGAYAKGLNEILQLHPVLFHYINTGERTFDDTVLNTQAVGLLAQEVQLVFPECVGTDDDGYLNLNMHAILIATINAVKDLAEQNKALKAQNEQLKSDVLSFDDDIKKIKTQLGLDLKAER